MPIVLNPFGRRLSILILRKKRKRFANNSGRGPNKFGIHCYRCWFLILVWMSVVFLDVFCIFRYLLYLYIFLFIYTYFVYLYIFLNLTLNFKTFLSFIRRIINSSCFYPPTTYFIQASRYLLFIIINRKQTSHPLLSNGNSPTDVSGPPKLN